MDSRRCERLCDSKLNCCPGSFFLRGNLDAWVLPGVLSDVSSSFFPHHLTCDSRAHPLLTWANSRVVVPRWPCVTELVKLLSASHLLLTNCPGKVRKSTNTSQKGRWIHDRYIPNQYRWLALGNWTVIQLAGLISFVYHKALELADDK
jgi:hypothetical protein